MILASADGSRAGRRPLVALLCGLLLALLPVLHVQAQSIGPDMPLQFNDAAEEQRFHDLAAQLRCVMCQNQSLADSNAQIARDLRHEVLDLMRQGKSDREIKDFLVARYGEFVLYKPDFDARTWLLWLGPGILLVIGAVVLVWVVRKRARTPVPVDDAQEW